MPTFRKEKGQSFESLIREFNRAFKNSGKAKERKRRESQQTKRRVTSKAKRKKQALHRLDRALEIARLKKLGRFKDERKDRRK